jgi:hypothetical protein
LAGEKCGGENPGEGYPKQETLYRKRTPHGNHDEAEPNGEFEEIAVDRA